MGMNLSPRVISDLFSGRNRHSTLMLHSAFASAIVREQTVAGGLQRDKEGFPQERGEKRKRTKYSSPERWMGASATAPASKQRLAGGAFGRNLGNYRLLGESPAKFIKGMWIEEGWRGRICCFEVSSSWGVGGVGG